MNLSKLRGALAEQRMTQRELASRLNLSVKSVNEKLNGKVQITVDEANQMTKILKLDNPEAIFFD